VLEYVLIAGLIVAATVVVVATVGSKSWRGGDRERLPVTD
jgi:hypothetical protein